MLKCVNVLNNQPEILFICIVLIIPIIYGFLYSKFKYIPKNTIIGILFTICLFLLLFINNAIINYLMNVDYTFINETIGSYIRISIYYVYVGCVISTIVYYVFNILNLALKPFNLNKLFSKSEAEKKYILITFINFIVSSILISILMLELHNSGLYTQSIENSIFKPIMDYIFDLLSIEYILELSLFGFDISSEREDINSATDGILLISLVSGYSYILFINKIKEYIFKSRQTT